MGADLEFNSFVICDDSAGDVYSRADAMQVGQLAIADVVFANSAGREARVTGNQNSGDTAFTIRYAASAKGVCVIYKDSVAAMETFLTNVRTQLTDPDSVIASLTDRDGTYTGMRWMYFRPVTNIQLVELEWSTKYMILFDTAFARYTVP